MGGVKNRFFKVIRFVPIVNSNFHICSITCFGRTPFINSTTLNEPKPYLSEIRVTTIYVFDCRFIYDDLIISNKFKKNCVENRI